MEAIKKRIEEILKEKSMVSAEEWADIAGDLVLLKGAILNNRRIAEMAANRKFKEIRAKKESNVDANTDWKATEEYEKWQEWEDNLSDFESLERIARKEAEIRKKNTF